MLSVCVTVETQWNAVVEIISSSARFWNDMVALNIHRTKLVTNATAPLRRHDRLRLDIRWKSHIELGLLKNTHLLEDM